jgi:hypothetical protein
MARAAAFSVERAAERYLGLLQQVTGTAAERAAHVGTTA